MNSTEQQAKQTR